jgi:hypothetical protein
VLPIGRKFGRIFQKGPSKKVSGWTNPWPNLAGILPERAKKGPNFETVNCLYFFLRNSHEKLDLSQVLGLKLLKKWFPFDQNNFLSGRTFWPVRPDYLEESW